MISRIIYDNPDPGQVETIEWYLQNKKWWENILSGDYQNYYMRMYDHR